MKKEYKMKSKTTRKLAMAGVFTALAVVGSMLSVPIASSKCAPVQHMINILSAVLLGPGYSVGIASWQAFLEIF